MQQVVYTRQRVNDNEQLTPYIRHSIVDNGYHISDTIPHNVHSIQQEVNSRHHSIHQTTDNISHTFEIIQHTTHNIHHTDESRRHTT